MLHFVLCQVYSGVPARRRQQSHLWGHGDAEIFWGFPRSLQRLFCFGSGHRGLHCSHILLFCYLSIQDPDQTQCFCDKWFCVKYHTAKIIRTVLIDIKWLGLILCKEVEKKNRMALSRVLYLPQGQTIRLHMII